MFFFFKQKTAYEMRISDWSSDVCSSDLLVANQQFDIGLATRAHEVAGMSASTFLRSVGACILPPGHRLADLAYIEPADLAGEPFISLMHGDRTRRRVDRIFEDAGVKRDLVVETQYAITHCNLVTLGVGCSIVNPANAIGFVSQGLVRSEEHTSELQSLMRISYAVFCFHK